MGIGTGLRQAWPVFWTLRKRRSEPVWARLLLANSLAFALSFALVTLAGLLRLAWFDPSWWRSIALPLMGVGVVVGNTLLAAFRALELGLGDGALERLRTGTSWRCGVILNALAAAAILLGCAIGMGLVGAFVDSATWTRLADTGPRIHFALLVLVLVGFNATGWCLSVRRLARQQRADEAALHLLQAQIEPQFLFNTLADVQDLLEHDPDRARRMLEEFTDYLRASLGQLRRPDSTLGAELDMAQCYLQLLQLRMGGRLRFSIDAEAPARAAVVPPLLLQPLVENAIRHGLAPRPAGGSVHIDARVGHGRLAISVRDDGVGLADGVAGTGFALDNIRARLQTRYGGQATLTLAAHPPGMRALIDLPLIGPAVDSSHRT